MGNVLAIKIHHIHDTSILKAILFSEDQKIVPYIHFITKINNYYPENLRKGLVIHEFTIFNILTRKDYVIRIERVESRLFFDGLVFTLDPIPHIQQFLQVTKVLDGSPAHLKALKPDNSIILGIENQYFSKFEEVDICLNKKEKKFLFYDFLQEKVNIIDFNFEGYGDYLGFECELKSIQEICNIIKNRKYENSSKNKCIFEIKNDCMNEKLFANDGFSENSLLSSKENNPVKKSSTSFEELPFKISEIKNDISRNFHDDTKNSVFFPEKQQKLIELLLETEKNDSYEHDKLSNENSNLCNINSYLTPENGTQINKILDQDAQEDFKNEISIQNKLLSDKTLKLNLIEKKETVVENCEQGRNKDHNNADNKKEYLLLEPAIRSLKLEEEIINNKAINFSYKFEKIEELVTSFPQNNFSKIRHDFQNESFLINNKNTNQTKNFTLNSNYDNGTYDSLINLKLSNNKIKNKYNKTLLIYDKVDSNYNFLKTSVATCSEKIILIKGFLLSENEIKFSPSILSLEKNTIDVN
jgi:hypothetical protein